MGKRLRIGVIGVGRRGLSHVQTIKELADVYELVAFCDPAYANGKPLPEALKSISGYTSVRELLSGESLDAAVVATPPETHHIIAAMLAERGIPMLIETPLATTRAMMDSLAEAVAKAEVPVEVGENMWRRPVEQLNQKAVANGLIGRVLRVSSYYESAGVDSCYHTMSLLRTYAGPDVQDVRSFSQVFPLDSGAKRTNAEKEQVTVTYSQTGLTSERWTQAELRYTNGVIGSCTYVTSTWAPLRRGHPRFMTIEGTEGFIITGDSDVNMLRRVENGVPHDYRKQVDFRDESDKKIPGRYYYATNPRTEYLNPFADRYLTDAGSGGVPSDGIARAHELLALHAVGATGAKPSYGVSSARRDQELSITIHEAARREGWLRSDQLGPETEWEHVQHETFQKQWGLHPIRDLPIILKNI